MSYAGGISKSNELASVTELPSVLHIWNLSGGSSLIAKYYGKLYGGTSTVIHRKDFDPFGWTEYYGGKAVRGGARVFTLKALLESRKWDIVQVHSFDKIVPYLKVFYPRKPVVLQYHGADVLGMWDKKRGKWRSANFLTYSTPDMAPGAPNQAKYLTDMVDTEVFKPQAVERVPKSAFTFSYNMDAEAGDYAKEHGLSLTIARRYSIPMAEMPGVFSRNEFFLDFRRRNGQSEPIKCVGTGAAQALACGAKVVDWEGKVHEGLPEERLPEKIMGKWVEVYAELAKLNRK